MVKNRKRISIFMLSLMFLSNIATNSVQATAEYKNGHVISNDDLSLELEYDDLINDSLTIEDNSVQEYEEIGENLKEENISEDNAVVEIITDEILSREFDILIDEYIETTYFLKEDMDSYSIARAIGNIEILSEASVSVERAQQWARGKNATETFISLAPLYEKYAKSRGGVNWLVAYVQAAKETGYGRFGGVLDESYHNPCGLKNTSGGGDYDANAHKKFDNWDQGVIAHLDHLALYAGASGYPKNIYQDKWIGSNLNNNETYDPRHFNYLHGKCKTVNSLGGNWAPSPTYGVEILNMYAEVVNLTVLDSKSWLDNPKNGDTILNGTLNVDGWALTIDGIKEVKVYLDNNLIGNAITGIPRADVASKYPGYDQSNNAGFSGSFDVSNILSGTKNLKVEIISNNNSLQTYERTINIENNGYDPKMNLDEPSNNITLTSDELRVAGWAIHGSGVKEVQVYLDQNYIGSTKTGGIRNDVGNVYPNYTNSSKSGFDAKFDISNISNGSKKLTVTMIANDGTKLSSTKTINLKRVELIARSNLDIPSNNITIDTNELRVAGWALHKTGVKEIKVSLDGTLVGKTTTGGARADVNKAYPGYKDGANSGFDAKFDISNISNGNRTLKVEIIANDGSSQVITRTVKVSKQELIARSNLDIPSNNATINTNELRVAGWALHKTGVKEIKVSLDGTLVGKTTTGGARADVNKAYPGYKDGANSGFDAKFDISNISNGNRTLKVEIIANDGSSQVITRTVKVSKQELIARSNLDIPSNNAIVEGNTLEVAGWALHKSGIKEVNVYINGSYVGKALVGTSRPDVAAAYPGYSSGINAGFNGNIDITNISTGRKTIEIEIVANDGTVQSHTRDISIVKEKLPAKSYIDKPGNNLTVSDDKLNIAGWALDETGIKEIKVTSNGKDLGTIKTGVSRPDVAAAYPKYPDAATSGFDGTVNISKLPSGKNVIKIEIIANSGESQIYEKTINIKRNRVIVIDAGHNYGGDTGAVRTFNGVKYDETELNMQLAEKVKAELIKKGFEVVMTRNTGERPVSSNLRESLQQRVDIANNCNADLFISIHHNASTSSSAYGFEAYYSSDTSALSGVDTNYKVNKSKEIGTALVNNASSQLSMYNRGLKDDAFYVVKNTNMPAILIENGFISNPTEAAKISSSSYQQKLAEIIANVVSEKL